MASVLDFLGEAMMDGADSTASSGVNYEGIQRIDIDLIKSDPEQPRRLFDEEKLENLAASIRQMDLLQPILVREEAGLIIMVDGERRWRAAKMAGLKDVPVVFSKQAQARVLLAQVVANENRENLMDIELAKVINTLKREYKITGRELGKLLNRNDAQISRLMLLVKNPEILQLAEEGIITSAEHAALFSALDPDTQAELVAQAKDNQTALTHQDLTAQREKPQTAAPTVNERPMDEPDADSSHSPNTDDLGSVPDAGIELQGECADGWESDDSINTTNHDESQTSEFCGEENTTKAKGAGSLTLTPAQFSALYEDNPSILDGLTSITLKAPPELIAELSDWGSAG
ncbi:ParB/RepB/Spo0J family partition protein [Halothiobacillus neapolitanus]|uniref:ParB-like partition protein n=1 Tax=Halothiobacillus neapolitanus (strain ATCC 23641 / DSM 15147 / CIP 104769 / NCIMB 8539 / c2) TaxID=555778 RepID=D0L1C3_HALNC|nr:ParB/RepB/Spo0J family partition protein [Halothiobacillus neapolitanus]ACX96496.1 parB-like partition protein [Halothiobacillus neapolitanus c2]TDN65397.1 ParB/RepB/Spo0J family partition protein [Halothiobacillus neapolitanus]